MTRPLMPRSLRSKPPGVSGEKPGPRGSEKRAPGAGPGGTISGRAGGGSACVPEVLASTESEADPDRRKKGARQATSAAVPRSAKDVLSQGATIEGCGSLTPAPVQERETDAAGKDAGPYAGQRRPRPSGSHAPDAYDDAEGAEGAAADATDVRCLLGCTVSFRREDFVADPHDDRGYDVVCLFSVVKWMHLNGGDEAVRNVFRKAHALLRPGGRLVLEPQVWRAPHKTQLQNEKCLLTVEANFCTKCRPGSRLPPSLLP